MTLTLVTVAPGHQLAPGPAAAYLAMRADGCPAGITDAGRTNAEQWAMWWAYLAGNLTATAAYPGTSNHETGYALDLPAGPAVWVRAYGAAYGWIADLVKGEWWHFEFVARTPAPTPAPLTPTTEDDDDMIPLIERTYRDLNDRVASLDEIADWHDAARGRTAAWFLTAFRANKAEPGTVRAAWRLYLHEPDAAEVAFQLRQGYTIGRLFEVAAEAAAEGKD